MRNKTGSQPSILLIGFVLYTTSVIGYLDLFSNIHEVMRLLGVSAELYYVREGQVNNYALNFVIPVPTNVPDITFTWQSLAGRPLPYNINIASSNLVILPRPILSIPSTGEIPIWVETFSIELKCSAIQPVEVEITIKMEVILNRSSNNITKLIVRRKKTCLVSYQDEKALENPVVLETSGPELVGLSTFIVGGVSALILVIILIGITYCAVIPVKKKTRHQQTSFQRLQSNLLCKTYVASSIMTPTQIKSAKKKESQHPEELHARIAELTVERCRVRLSNLIQEGTFGRVYRGTYNENQDVLVKTVAQHSSQIQVSLLLQEGMCLYGASHPGILSVLGVSIEDHAAPFVLYSVSNNTQNLKEFLLEPSCARSITTIHIVMISSQVSLALGHLHRHGVVHKDIASRNCVIDDHFHVKLGDSSLSRDLFPADYNCLGDSENRPVKWMSLEALRNKNFSEASDSWAFGVLMWELCTFAKQPYAEVDPFEMEHYLKDGYRLAQPFNCPDELFTIMAYCWALLPIERPLFTQLHACLSDFYAQITRYV